MARVGATMIVHLASRPRVVIVNEILTSQKCRECCCAGFTPMDSDRPVANRSNRSLKYPRCEATWIRDDSDVGSETVYTGSVCSGERGKKKTRL